MYRPTLYGGNVMTAGIRERVKQAAIEIGFDAVGVARAELSPHGGVLRRWLDGGHHAGMTWMARRIEEREDPRVYAPGVRSIISLVLNSYNGEPDGPVAMYARGVDYHLVFKEKSAALVSRLAEILPGCGAIACCDTSPVLERAWAERAGIGWIGKSGQLISRRFGAWLLLGEILLDREIDPDEPHADMCGTCDRCVRACPTGAVIAGRTVNSKRCISYLTIEHRGEIPAEHRPALRGHLFGCDVCLAACPFNRFEREASDSHLCAGEHLVQLGLLPEMDATRFRQLFGKTALARPKLGGMQRNYSIAMR